MRGFWTCPASKFVSLTPNQVINSVPGENGKIDIILGSLADRSDFAAFNDRCNELHFFPGLFAQYPESARQEFYDGVAVWILKDLPQESVLLVSHKVIASLNKNKKQKE